MLTAMRRTELNRVAQARAIRVAIWDVACGFVVLFAVNLVAELWPDYWAVPLSAAAVVFIGFTVNRYDDWKAMSYIERRLEKDETAGL